LFFVVNSANEALYKHSLYSYCVFQIWFVTRPL